MTLHTIVAALGGDLYHGGSRANIPAPGHSAHDRSISLWLTDGHVIIYSFGAADWRDARDDLRARGFIDTAGRLIGTIRHEGTAPRPDTRQRRETAARLWADTVDLQAGDPAGRYLIHRAIRSGGAARALGFHPQAPVSVYRAAGTSRPALVARISDADDQLTAVEIAYLSQAGRPATGLRLARKTVGHVPPGAAVRLASAEAEMLVAEGVATTLSASERFGLPGWALMAAHNLAAWSPPDRVRRVLIAADRGEVGEGAAMRLQRRLIIRGVAVQVIWPDAPFSDWNAVAVAETKARRKGAEGCRSARMGLDARLEKSHDRPCC